MREGEEPIIQKMGSFSICSLIVLRFFLHDLLFPGFQLLYDGIHVLRHLFVHLLRLLVIRV